MIDRLRERGGGGGGGGGEREIAHLASKPGDLYDIINS